MMAESADLLKKAEENIQAGDVLIKASFFEIAISRGYYAILYIAEALLVEEGIVCSSHRQVQSHFGQIFAKSRKLDPKFHSYLLSSFRKRQVADYHSSSEVTDSEAIEVLNHAEEFLNAAKIYLTINPPRTPR